MNTLDISKSLNDINLLKKEKKFAIAVSGGVDSMTLLHLVVKWAKKNSKKVLVLSFNHNLRKESIEEVRLVESVSKTLNLDYRSFTWKEKPCTAVMEKARIARYETFSNFCSINNIKSLLVAHTADDIAETFAIRVLNGSDLDGLCPIAYQRKLYGVNVIRPMLDKRKSEIYKFAINNKILFKEDPSNENFKYLRARLRKYLISEEDLSNNLIKASKLFCKIRKINNDIIRVKFKNYYTLEKEGYFVIRKRIFTKFPKFLVLRFLKKCLMFIGNTKYPPRTKKMNDIFNNLLSNKTTNYSLGGCILSSKKREILIIREFNKVGNLFTDFKDKESLIWDNRFVISNLSKNNFYRIFALGNIIEEKYVRDMLKNNRKYITNMPYYVKKVLPVIKTLEGSIFIPHLIKYRTKNFDKIKIEINEFNDKNNKYSL